MQTVCPRASTAAEDDDEHHSKWRRDEARGSEEISVATTQCSSEEARRVSPGKTTGEGLTGAVRSVL